MIRRIASRVALRIRRTVEPRGELPLAGDRTAQIRIDAGGDAGHATGVKLHDAIAVLLEDPLDQILARSILGTADVAEIADRVSGFVAAQLGRAIVDCPLFIQSVGAVFGLDLDDGARVVLKVHAFGEQLRGFGSLEELDAVYAAQTELAAAGYPCARVVVPPCSFDPRTAAAITAWLDPGKSDAPGEPSTRRALAAMLARSVELCATLTRSAQLPRAILPGDRVLPHPHNALFDFTRPEGGWIDERARQARAILDEPAPLVVMHTDVSGANARVVDGALAAVYDMDSVAWIDEHRCVASAAVHFTYTGEPGWRWPTRDEALAYIADYEALRGYTLDRRRLDAAMIYSMAYTARCELGPGGLGAMGQALAALA